jgi:hypothetical protein
MMSFKQYKAVLRLLRPEDLEDILMTETTLVSSLSDIFRLTLKGYIVFKHHDQFTHGVPDLSVTGVGRTSWLECKYANPDFKSEGIQELTMLRLAATSFARYVIYDASKNGRRTLIVEPRHLANWRDGAFMRGFDHDFVVETIRQQHEVARW